MVGSLAHHYELDVLARFLVITSKDCDTSASTKNFSFVYAF